MQFPAIAAYDGAISQNGLKDIKDIFEKVAVQQDFFDLGELP